MVPNGLSNGFFESSKALFVSKYFRAVYASILDLGEDMCQERENGYSNQTQFLDEGMRQEWRNYGDSDNYGFRSSFGATSHDDAHGVFMTPPSLYSHQLEICIYPNHALSHAGRAVGQR
jgi:hypothetical protein